MLNLDTHILLGTLSGTLAPRERDLIRGHALAISDIVLWEIAKLSQLGRIEFEFDDPIFRKVMRQLTVYPITPQIARQSAALDFRSDSADEVIAATSIVERLPLLTRDRKILKSRMVPFAK